MRRSRGSTRDGYAIRGVCARWRRCRRGHAPGVAHAARAPADRPRHRSILGRAVQATCSVDHRVMRRLLLFTFGFVLPVACSKPRDSEAAQATSALGANQSAAVSASRRTALTEAVRLVSPVVVTVQTEIVERTAADPFDIFFGGDRPTQRAVPGLGSGFIARADGIIVTNAHVVAGATNVSVMLRDGKTFP